RRGELGHRPRPGRQQHAGDGAALGHGPLLDGHGASGNREPVRLPANRSPPACLWASAANRARPASQSAGSLSHPANRRPTLSAAAPAANDPPNGSATSPVAGGATTVMTFSINST